ncbi:MAG TPA: efflux RND transporter periplasmic adaptor subunit, partial [Clostridia bacterium]
KAPVDGTYILKNVNIGDMVNVGSSIGTISDLNDLWLKVHIPQRNIGAVKLNQEVELKSISLPGEPIKGKIIFISDKAEFTPKDTETSEAKENTVFMIKIKVMNNIEKLKPGMSLDAFLPSGGK